MTTFKKIWSLLTSSQRRDAILLLGLMLVGTILVTLSVGLVIPALTLMTQSDLVARYPGLAPVLNGLGNPSQDQLVIIGMVALVGIYAVKALFLSFLAWKQMRFVYGIQADLSRRFYVCYLSQPYAFHLQRNSAHLIRNAIMETNLFTQTVLMAGVTFLIELSALLGILALLLAVEPVGALLAAAILGIAGWSFNKLSRGRILRWGEARQLHEGFRIQHLQQGLGGAKDVKLLGRESDFIAQYDFHNVSSARAGQLQSTIQQVPQLLFEFIAVCGLAVLVIVMISQNKPLEALLPTVGLFAAAAFRLLPSANRIIGAIQNVRYALPVVNVLYAELELLNASLVHRVEQSLSFKQVISLEHVNFRHVSAESKTLQDVSLLIHCGASVGFIGSSGAGKSTLVDLILGLLTPDSGFVKVDDIDIQSNLRGWQDQIGYVPESIFLTDDTLRRNVAFGLSDEKIDEDYVWRAIRSAQLEQFVKDLPQGLDTLVGERGIRLSGGQRQRIGIARALYHNPSVLVLDEATSSLDIVTEQGVMEAVRALKGDKTVIIVAHRLSTVEHCERIFKLERGRIVEEGAADDVLAKVTPSVLSMNLRSPETKAS